jgi:hypothetical protein
VNYLYQELKSWQGVIGSLLGFFALMAGALFNFHLNRRRDNRLRSEESLSLAAALYGEILLLSAELARVAVAVANRRFHQTELNEHFLEAFSLSEPMLYKAVAPKIGLLKAELVISITEFYKNFQQAKTWLPLLVKNKDRNFLYASSHVLIPARDAVRDIIPTLREIELMANISKPAVDLDLGNTDDIIEMESDD